MGRNKHKRGHTTSNSSMNLTCEVILPFLSFRIRNLNLTRAVGFGKSTEGPGKDVLARWMLGHWTQENPFIAHCPCFPEGLMGSLGIVSLAASHTTWHASEPHCPGCCLCRDTFQLGDEEVPGCCPSPCLRLCLQGPDSWSCLVGDRRKGVFLCQSQY